MGKIVKDLKIEKLVYKGYGLGFKNSIPFFVSYSVPEDLLDIEITHTKKDVSFGIIKKIKKESENRIKPECEVFGECGGCDWLNIPYRKQLEYKQQVIEEIFRKLQIEEINRMIDSNDEKFYRNKSYFPITQINGKPVIGMFARKSHQVIPHKKCEIHPPIFDKLISDFQKYLIASKTSIYNEKTGKGTAKHLGIRFSKTTNELLIIYITKTRKMPFSKQLVRMLREKYPNIIGIVQNINPKQTNTLLAEDEKILYGRDYLYDQIGGFRFKLNYKSFFQINSSVSEKMYNFVKDNLEPDTNVIDAFCGVGTISIFIAEKVKKVFGIENNANAINDANKNLEINDISNCEFLNENVENILPDIIKRDIDTIIFDPPRKGLDEKSIISLPQTIKKVIYISCNPTTQKRDVEKFMGIGFHVKMMQAFDMFPQTYHIENVLILER
ncbi:MAG: 23S rRNA (uracil(1939)-C(5))-methyltransferase RlmD [Armatimonadetes bacterium]|nr:23S rRNA (uracil(1939)-C(5))-methyltransferase RlmD [Armatimonadota bacterium]